MIWKLCFCLYVLYIGVGPREQFSSRCWARRVMQKIMTISAPDIFRTYTSHNQTSGADECIPFGLAFRGLSNHRPQGVLA